MQSSYSFMRIPWHKLLPFYNICVVFFHNLCIHEVYILQLTWRVTYRKCYIPNIFASVKHFKQRREEDIGKGQNVFVSWQILSISANFFFLVDTGPFFAQHALTLTFKWPWPLTIKIEKKHKVLRRILDNEHLLFQQFVLVDGVLWI